MSDEKIYIGSGEEHVFKDGGKVIKAQICLDGIKNLWNEYGYTAKSGKKMFKIIISERKEKGRYNETHSITVDTWKPQR